MKRHAGFRKSEKIPDEIVGRLCADFERRAYLLNGSLFNENDAISDIKGFILIVRNKNRGQARLVVKPAGDKWRLFIPLDILAFGDQHTETLQHGGNGSSMGFNLGLH